MIIVLFVLHILSGMVMDGYVKLAVANSSIDVLHIHVVRIVS